MRPLKGTLPRLSTLAVLAALSLGGCSPSRGLEAWALLDDLAAGPFAREAGPGEPEVRREAIAYEVDGRRHQGDFYRAVDPPGAPLVLVPGAAVGGKDDPYLVATARSLARARFAVLVPDIANLRQLKVAAADASEVGAAIRHLAEQNDSRDQAVVGVVAVSYAVGPALLAILKPPARDLASFVVAIGGYYDLEAVITFFATGRYRESPGAPWRHRQANAYGKWVFVLSNADRLDDRRDRMLLSIIARRKLRHLDAEISDLVSRLGPQGRSVHRLLVNRDPERVPELIAALPPAVRSEIAELDLKRQDLSTVTAEVILIHGLDDPIIPETESQSLARALPDGRAHLYLVENLAHAELEPGGLVDNLTLWRAAYRMLAARDAAIESLRRN